MRRTSLLVLALAGCLDAGDSPEPAPRVAPIIVHTVTINADGTFSPPVVDVHSGEYIEWVLPSKFDAIVRAAWDGTRYAPRAYDAGSAGEITGPMTVAPGGVFTLSPNPKGAGLGLADVGAAACPNSLRITSAGGSHLCQLGPAEQTMASTWSDPAITGVFIRLRWDLVDNGPNANPRYDFNHLDHEIDAAVASGKLYSLAFEAGKHGTPGWLSSQLGIPTAQFVDTDTGATMTLPAIWDARYISEYTALLQAVATHLKENAARYRALAYVKPSGANLFTTENRLPKDCTINYCNDREWSVLGYRPNLIDDFYRAQFQSIADAFPRKAMSYELIQAGFPRINDQGGYVDETGAIAIGTQPGAFMQTSANIAIGSDAANDYHERFAVQHCGLQPMSAVACQDPYNAHPDPADVGSGCPNTWAVAAGSDGQPTTFQTVNLSQISTLSALEGALDNAEVNTLANMVEIYEELAWLAAQDPWPGATRPSLEAWDAALRARAGMPTSYRVMAPVVARNAVVDIKYINPYRCNATTCPSAGTIRVRS